MDIKVVTVRKLMSTMKSTYHIPILVLYQSFMALQDPANTLQGSDISDAVIEAMVQSIHALFGSDVSQVLALHLGITINKFNFPRSLRRWLEG